LFREAISFNQSLENWNTSAVTNMNSMFSGAISFNQSLENWNTSAVTNMNSMFSGAISFNQPLENWNTSAVTEMNWMFYGASSFNQPLENWNTSAVKQMYKMFDNAIKFNQPLENWNTSAVTNMSYMFSGASSFNQPLEKWNTSAVKDMSYMFSGASSFNQPLEKWNTSAVKDMSYMFSGASSFNQPLEKWNTSAVTWVYKMFEGATNFNQPLGNWDISSFTNTEQMFKGASAFNQDLSQWDFSNIISLLGMFENAISFNQSLDNWNLSNVKNMDRFLFGAISFNQSLENLKINSLTTANYMIENCGMSCSNYSKTIQNWATNPNTPSNITLFVTGRIYSPDISNYRDSLIKNKKWRFYGDRPNKSICSDSNASFVYSNLRSKYLYHVEEANFLVDSFWILGYNLKQDIKIKSNSTTFKISEKNDSNYDTILNLKTVDSVLQKQLIYIKFEANQFRYHYASLTFESGNLKDTFKIEGERKSESMLNNMVEKASYKIYPNPSFGQLHIETNVPENIKIINSTGKVIHHLTGENDYKVDIQHLPTGYYFIVTENGFTYKLLKL
jgi:surface protein